MSFDVRQERDRVDRRAVGRIGAGGVVVLLLSLAAAALLLAHTPRERAAAPALAPPRSTVERPLVLATKRGLDQREAQRRALETWGWVDRDAGVARISIERAMELVVATDGGAP